MYQYTFSIIIFYPCMFFGTPCNMHVFGTPCNAILLPSEHSEQGSASDLHPEPWQNCAFAAGVAGKVSQDQFQTSNVTFQL